MVELLSSLASANTESQGQSIPFSLPPPEAQHQNAGVSSLFPGTPMTTKISVNTVNLLASQLPEFSGKDDNDVELWIQKVERVIRIHGASQDVMLLAASGKLVKSARKWFEIGTGTINDTWSSFKGALLRHFRKKIPFEIVMKRVGSRKWNYPHESF